MIINKEDVKDILTLAMFAGRFYNNKSASPEERRLANYLWTLVQAGDVEGMLEIANERAEKYGM
jgi:hypothetical protein